MGWVVNATPRALYPPGKTKCQLYRRLGWPQGRSGREWKTSPPPGFDPRIVQPAVSYYTNYAFPAIINRRDKTEVLLPERKLHETDWCDEILHDDMIQQSPVFLASCGVPNTWSFVLLLLAYVAGVHFFEIVNLYHGNSPFYYQNLVLTSIHLI